MALFTLLVVSCIVLYNTVLLFVHAHIIMIPVNASFHIKCHSPFKPSLIHVHVHIYTLRKNNPRIVPIHGLRTRNPRIARSWFVVKTMDPGFAQDNPWIAQIHASRITYIYVRAVRNKA